MAWLSQFKLGIPGSEISFDLNPTNMAMTEGPVMVVNENLAANLRKDSVKNYRPTFKINSNYFTLAQKQQFVSLAGLPVFLSFQTRDDWAFMEQDTPDDVNTVTIRSNSVTLLDKALNDVGSGANLTITGVFTNIGGTGTNYYTGGSYARSTRIITLGTPLINLNDVFVTYTYKGALVNIQNINNMAEGGWVDKFQYDFELQGV